MSKVVAADAWMTCAPERASIGVHLPALRDVVGAEDRLTFFPLRSFNWFCRRFEPPHARNLCTTERPPD